MIKGYIIEKYTHMTNAYTCNRLVSEAASLGMDLDIVGVYDTVIRGKDIITQGNILKPRDFVINRYKWGAVKDAINGLCSRSYNPLGAYNQYINKYEQVKNLKSDEFLIPRYILATSAIPFESLSEALGDKIVAKGLESSMGDEIILVEKQEDLDRMKKTCGPDKEWLFEEFIASSYGRDMRFYSIRGRIMACMQRRSKGDFRANVALGASVEPYEISPAMRKIARDIYDQTGLDFLGIDLLFGHDKPYFCEINVMPGIEGIEKASGLNIAKAIIETIQSDYREYSN